VSNQWRGRVPRPRYTSELGAVRKTYKINAFFHYHVTYQNLKIPSTQNPKILTAVDGLSLNQVWNCIRRKPGLLIQQDLGNLHFISPATSKSTKINVMVQLVDKHCNLTIPHIHFWHKPPMCVLWITHYGFQQSSEAMLVKLVFK